MLGVSANGDLGSLTLWLVTIHVLNALLMLAPSGAFAVLGKRAASPETGGHKMLEAILEIERKMVYPGAVIQLVSGAWLIERLGYADNFSSYGWLLVSIILFLALLGLSTAIDTPAIKRIVVAANAGQAPDPKDIKTSKTLGPILGILFAVIGFLMMAKPF